MLNKHSIRLVIITMLSCDLTISTLNDMMGIVPYILDENLH